MYLQGYISFDNRLTEFEGTLQGHLVQPPFVKPLSILYTILFLNLLISYTPFLVFLLSLSFIPFLPPSPFFPSFLILGAEPLPLSSVMAIPWKLFPLLESLSELQVGSRKPPAIYECQMRLWDQCFHSWSEAERNKFVWQMEEEMPDLAGQFYQEVAAIARQV
uniref:Uncharacterized protein n=1 Tax=Naja naja TaxID=35670 RepID=A0A8C6XNT4_NAJNA